MNFEIKARRLSGCYWTGLKYTKGNNSWDFTDGADIAFATSSLRISPNESIPYQCVVICKSEELLQPNVTDCTQKKDFFCQHGERPAEPPISTGQDTHICQAKLLST